MINPYYKPEHIGMGIAPLLRKAKELGLPQIRQSMWHLDPVVCACASGVLGVLTLPLEGDYNIPSISDWCSDFVYWNEMFRINRYPCPVCLQPRGHVDAFMVHMNDHHNATFENIAEWFEATWDDSEGSRVNLVPPSPRIRTLTLALRAKAKLIAAGDKSLVLPLWTELSIKVD